MPKSTNKNVSVSKIDVSYDQLQKYWSGLTQHGRQDVLKVDKQTFLKQVREFMFCSRCYRFLDEEFSQIVEYGKSSKQDGAVGHHSCNRPGIQESGIVGGLSQGDDQDPSIHPWGCLTTTRDGTDSITLLDCFSQSTSLKGIQKVFDSARKRESERKLLFPVACGVGGRKWKGPASREACAVHTVRLPLEKLVDFWSSQGEESRQSILKMKEADFNEQLRVRIKDMKFCSNCRKNVMQEFKELKELTSIRKESGFHFQYEDTAKAHASMEKQYVHSRLVVGDGFVTVTEGESMQNFFKHAEEVVKEDSSLVDENGNRLDRECSHNEKNARTPELARKFLMDAAAVFFKEQVEKAIREKRARYNAHSVFVSLVVNMLEEHVHVSCKELHILENQIKLLNEEEKEKIEEEERKERRRMKEREKKLRRRERTRDNDKNEDNSSVAKQHSPPQISIKESTVADEELGANEEVEDKSSRPVSPHAQDGQEINECTRKSIQDEQEISSDKKFAGSNSKNGSCGSDQLDTTSKCSTKNQLTVVPRSGTMIKKSERSYHGDHLASSSRSATRQNMNSRKAKSIMRAGDMSNPPLLGNKFTRGDHIRYTGGRPKRTPVAENISSIRDSPHTKKGRQNNSVPSSKSLVSERLPTSNSESASPQSEGIDASRCLQTGVRECEEVVMAKKQLPNEAEPIRSCSLDGRRIHTPGKASKENGNGNPDDSHMYFQAQGNPMKEEPMQKQRNAAAGEENLNSDISPAEDKGFSFFHFGCPFPLAEDKSFSFFHYDSPFALADASTSDSLPSEENKRDSFEEFNLFATKGITFSIFSK